jgi:hypothetical protein
MRSARHYRKKKKQKFDDSVMFIGAKYIFASLGNNSKPEDELRKALNGKTVNEVIAEADKLRAAAKK